MIDNAHTIIRKCTRDGYTSWFNAAKMLGMTPERARALYGASKLAMVPIESEASPCR